MSTPNFASILDEAPTEIERPQPLPTGTYLTRVIGQPRYDESTRKRTPLVEFQLKLMAAEEDVDEDDLKEALRGASLQDRVIPLTFYITEDAIYRLDEFHQHCGLDLENEATRKARNEEVINSEVRIVIAHEPSNRPGDSTIYARVRRTLAAE